MPHYFAKRCLIFCLLMNNWGSSAVSAGPSDNIDWDAFPENDFEADHNAISGSQLSFLQSPPTELVHHHHNTITLSEPSLKNGWVHLSQCHKHMDPFPKAQIVYNEGRIADLKIISFDKIESAWVDGNTIQLVNVSKGGGICIKARSLALVNNPDGTYTLHNGPYMRQFLDGFFPMRVSMDVIMPPQLQFVSISPKQQSGFKVEHSGTRLHYNAWFEGRLNTEITFRIQ